MGKKLEEIRKDNLENIKIGFFLEMKFRQDFILKNLKEFQFFLEDNKIFMNDIFLCSMVDNIKNFSSLFSGLIDIPLSFLDVNEDFCKYHKDFY